MRLSWEDISMWLYGAVTTLGAAVVLLVRKVLTNERQIELLQREIALREEHNKEKFDKIDFNLTEIRTDIKALIGKE